ncbi:MAG: 2-amino-4-hydroxy-6-hydroxymethyldihydropteridine diphosphokinase [Lachnospiraceae bacterium]|nr:2-amino-4-hydroxy-6-hydroxymethyldihydropteridine diphosphokinase [Lachnospiraceae bacterium]
MDKIEIRGIEIFAKHGVLPEENALGQKFLISASLFLDTGKAGMSDELSDSVNYAEVAAFLKEEASQKVFRLLEALAEHLAKKVLLSFPLVEKIRITIEKPWAPIGIPLDTVSVSVKRGWHELYLGIGSNMGEKRKNIEEAIRLLSEDEETKVLRVSELIMTKPVGYTEQDDFLNGALQVKTLRSPERFLDRIGEIEKVLKRERKIHWGPRTIDIDILLYDEEIIQTERLVIPHREMLKRRFVLEPLSEIAPYAVHPVTGKRVEELLAALEE